MRLLFHPSVYIISISLFDTRDSSQLSTALAELLALPGQSFYLFISQPPNPNESTSAYGDGNYLSASVAQLRCRDQHGTNTRTIPNVHWRETQNPQRLEATGDVLLTRMHRRTRTCVFL